MDTLGLRLKIMLWIDQLFLPFKFKQTAYKFLIECKCKCKGQNHAHGIKHYGHLDDEQRTLLSVTRKEQNSSYQSELIYEALDPKVKL